MKCGWCDDEFDHISKLNKHRKDCVNKPDEALLAAVAAAKAANAQTVTTAESRAFDVELHGPTATVTATVTAPARPILPKSMLPPEMKWMSMKTPIFLKVQGRLTPEGDFVAETTWFLR